MKAGWDGVKFPNGLALKADFMKVLGSNPESIDFEQTMAAIGEGYVYTPTAFSCGEIASTEEQNQGSAKIFSFAKLQNLDEATTLQLFGRYYREDVLKNPEGTDHGNIRNFMKAGWDGVKFPNGLALKAATSDVVALSVTLYIKPECREAFLVAIRNNQRGTLNKDLEPLALMYEYGEDPEKPNTWYFQERFRGEEGLRQHQAAPHFAAWEKFVQDYDPFSAPPEIKKFNLTENTAGTKPEPVV